MDDAQGSDSSGHSEGSGESVKGKKKQNNKRKRQSSNSASSGEGFVEMEGDEPAQLVTMLPVSGWLQNFDVSSCILPK